ncbi:MAG: hypothetical protein IT382_05530 [Deltaproteobacteria bacterium]|nr:hypothetical protein [Deltaproteobacteria bacterium]
MSVEAAPRWPRLLALALSLAPMLACATPVAAIKDQVRNQATGDLVCDHASIHIVQLRPLKKVQGQKQTIERGSFSAKGCGGYATYAVECIRGVCMVEREVDETLAPDKKKNPVPGAEASAP